jgi:ABC-type multidrug transport system fused ATPase/permease subunit
VVHGSVRRRLHRSARRRLPKISVDGAVFSGQDTLFRLSVRQRGHSCLDIAAPVALLADVTEPAPTVRGGGRIEFARSFRAYPCRHSNAGALMSRLELCGLTKRYGAHAAVDNLDLTLESGCLVSLLGPSGCGKTTTLRLVSGFVVPDGGSIRVAGQVMSSAGRVVQPEKRDMSMIFQSYALWPHLTVAENCGVRTETAAPAT